MSTVQCQSKLQGTVENRSLLVGGVATVVLLHTNSEIGPFLLFIFLPTVVFFLEKDKVKTKPVLKQAWPLARAKIMGEYKVEIFSPCW